MNAIRLEQKSIGTELTCADFIRRIAGSQNTDGLRFERLDTADQFQAIKIRHMHIRENNMDGLGTLNELPGSKTAGEGIDLAVHAEFERVDYKIPDQRVIFDDGNFYVGYDRLARLMVLNGLTIASMHLLGFTVCPCILDSGCRSR